MVSELRSGERQVAETIAGIRRDHVARYEWAAQRIGNRDTVFDFGCGVGYGTVILAQSAGWVIGIDRSSEAIAFAAAHYRPWPRMISYACADLDAPYQWRREPSGEDIGVAFEIIEHLPDPRPFLRAAAKQCGTLFASVPNDRAFPYRGQAFHYRHYSKPELAALLAETGWAVAEWWGQEGPESEVDPDLSIGRTLVVKATRRAAAETERDHPDEVDEAKTSGLSPVPKHVAIVGLGPSAEAYMDVVKRLGSRQAFADQVWAINALGDVLQCDLVFHMDDVRIQEIRAEAKPQSNIAHMLQWLKTAPGPIMTSIAHPDYPGLVEFPLEAVVNKLGRGYFNNTAAYAVAYAIYLGVEKISIFGCDYTYPDAHKAERGRACLEYWLGYASHLGIEIALPSNTTLMDSLDDRGEDDIVSYGYDAVRISCEAAADGMKLRFTPRDHLPSAEEIEHAYDHSRPPSEQRR